MVKLRIFLSLIFFAVLSGCASHVLNDQAGKEGDYLPASKTQSVVFIHGMYLTPMVWQQWEVYFQTLGYKTYSPAWPLHGQSVLEQNTSHPREELAELSLPEVVQYYQNFIEALEEPPILIGHSMGGLIVQQLLAKNIGAAGVAINSAPPQGVISMKLDFLKANWPHLSPFKSSSEPTQLTLEQFSFGFVNGESSDEQKTAFETYVVPESRSIGKAALSSDGEVDYEVARVPLLIVSGGKDNTIPASLNYSNFEEYRDSPAITDYKEFPDRNHWTILQPGWESVAGYAQRWLKANDRAIVYSEI
ncbi:MAG: alpha/beta hydrolase [Oleispira sp.]